jgi:hypothetical protein
MTNYDLKKRHVDKDFDAQTPEWMAAHGHRTVALLLNRKVFKCPDWYVDELLVCSR